MKTAEEILKGLRDWRRNFSKAWGAKNVKDLDNATQLSINWIDENVIAPVDEYIIAASQSKEESPAEFLDWYIASKWVHFDEVDGHQRYMHEVGQHTATAGVLYKLFLDESKSEPPEEKCAY